MSKSITKKNYKKNKKNIWKIYDKEINNKIECLYTNNKNIVRENCDLCGSIVSYSEEKFLTCTNKKCGIIYKDSMDETAEWRYYGASDKNMLDPTRCGMPINPLLKESSYGCKVLCGSRSTYEMRKIRRYTEWQSMPYREKSQYDEFQWIKLMSKKAGISKIIIDEALRYHKIISEEKTYRGLNRDGIIASSIYIASRIHNYPRTAKEIATIFNLDNTSATKGCKNAISILNKVEKNKENNEKTYFHQTKPIDFIERFCCKLNINNELTKLCQFIAIRIEKHNLIPENTPHSVSAGIIYFIANSCTLNISKKDVHTISNISEVTINKCFKKLYKMKEKLIPEIILQKYCAINK